MSIDPNAIAAIMQKVQSARSPQQAAYENAIQAQAVPPGGAAPMPTQAVQGQTPETFGQGFNRMVLQPLGSAFGRSKKGQAITGAQLPQQPIPAPQPNRGSMVVQGQNPVMSRAAVWPQQ
jgi:hypothetical protein